MRLYKTKKGIIIEREKKFKLVPPTDWDSFMNDDHLFSKAEKLFGKLQSTVLSEEEILAPLGNQELWACGVTYLRSKMGRQEESKNSGGSDFYARVYDAERPEVFFKSTPHRVVGHLGKLRIRKDSSWNVPEPELTLAVTSSGKIVGYTIGNDMSSRSIEGENPLYLPQAKTYDGCAGLGPCIYVPEGGISLDTEINLEISRKNDIVFAGSVSIRQMKRRLEELVSYVYRECSFPAGCLIMTGTGIVPAPGFTLQSGDRIGIRITEIGELVNEVE